MCGSEKDFCIKCDRGGKVLSCSDSSCPISVHEKCLGFLAKFDYVGNFCCPYCSYRRATEESRQAREKALLRKKALSCFIDMNISNEDKHLREGGKSEQKELGKLQNTVKENYNLDNENILDQAIFQKDSVQPEEGEEEDKFVSESTRRVLLHKEINKIFLGKEKNALSSKYGDNAHSSECNDRLVVAGHRTPSGLIVASGQDLYSEEEGKEQHFEIVKNGRWKRLENHKLPNDATAAKTVENHIKDSHFSEFTSGEKQGRENYFSTSAKGVDNDIDLVEEDKGHIEQEDDLEDQVQEKVSSFATDTVTLVLALEDKKGFKNTEMSYGLSDNTPASKHVKNDKRSGRPSDVLCLTRSCRISSSEVRANLEQVQELTASTELKQVMEPFLALSHNMFSSPKRKKLLWEDDEEEMLREGFQKYSRTGNKNIPWKKILEFGRHVFHDTRTPADLKDKWRNMFAKER